MAHIMIPVSVCSTSHTDTDTDVHPSREASPLVVTRWRQRLTGETTENGDRKMAAERTTCRTSIETKERYDAEL